MIDFIEINQTGSTHRLQKPSSLAAWQPSSLEGPVAPRLIDFIEINQTGSPQRLQKHSSLAAQQPSSIEGTGVPRLIDLISLKSIKRGAPKGSRSLAAQQPGSLAAYRDQGLPV